MVELPDFDSLRWLAQHAPEQLTALQHNLNQALIAEAAPNTRAQLRSMQHHLTLQMSRCTSPYARCFLTLRLMNDKFISLNELISDPQTYRDNKAQVLQFKRIKTSKINS